MSLTDQDIEQLIMHFNQSPNSDDYFFINEWYENTVRNHPNQEHMICIYVFLLGANIRHKYDPLTYEQHRDLIKEIRDIIETAPPIYRAQRKVYFDLGNKSGFFR